MLMDDVHEAAGRLHDANRIAITWKGVGRSVKDGPYRIGHPAA